MRFNLLDVFFAIACLVIGAVIGRALSFYLPGYFRPVAEPLGAVCTSLALVYPFYRGLKLFAMLVPRCPCCGNFQNGFHILDVRWPRVGFRCPTCAGEFAIWHDGRPGEQETWENP